MYSFGPPHMAVQKQDDQHEHTFSNYVRIREVVQNTCLRRWTIGKCGERGSEISLLPARHDDIYIYIYIYSIYIYKKWIRGNEREIEKDRQERQDDKSRRHTHRKAIRIKEKGIEWLKVGNPKIKAIITADQHPS